MAEVMVFLSAVQATTQLVEQACRIIRRLRTASYRQKSLVDVLTRHEEELESVKTIIGFIVDEEDLQIDSVAAELLRLQKVQHKLAELLVTLDRRAKTKVNQFAHQLLDGSADEKNLSAIMNELVHVKATILLRISVANVGVVSTLEKEVVANAVVIQRIDQYLREHINNCEGLRIARLLKGRRPSNDGTVSITLAELKSLSNESDSEDSGDETLVDDSEAPLRTMPLKTERIVLHNTSEEQALQINAALGEDICKDINRIVIRNNTAGRQSLQVNHGMNREMFMLMLDLQSKMIAAPRQKV